MVGMAMRAGKILCGFDTICKAMAKGGVKLVVITSDASEATKKRLLTKSEFYSIPAIAVPTDSEKLGALIGKTYAPVAIAITDGGLAEQIRQAGENMTKGSFRD